MVNWSRRFQDPIPMPDGSTIRTIGEAAEYATGLPAKVAKTEPWQRAARVLHEAAKRAGLQATGTDEAAGVTTRNRPSF